MTGDLLSGPARVAWVALSLIPRMGSRTLARLLDQFGSLDAILHANEKDLMVVRGVGPQMAVAIRSVDLARTQAQIAAWEAGRIAILVRGEGGYPAPLDLLADAPPVLFRRGSYLPADQRAVALVGTRTPSETARATAQTLAHLLAQHGWTVVSGLAAGIDTAAHQGALAAQGRTLAVLGCGIQVIYPPENCALADQISAQGALFSEVHPGAPPNSPALVARNRLISGLSRAVIVVETGETGGSLHAVRFARVQGRTLYAVPNEAAGNRRLIAEGARPIPLAEGAWDDLLGELDRLQRETF